VRFDYSCSRHLKEVQGRLRELFGHRKAGVAPRECCGAGALAVCETTIGLAAAIEILKLFCGRPAGGPHRGPPSTARAGVTTDVQRTWDNSFQFFCFAPWALAGKVLREVRKSVSAVHSKEVLAPLCGFDVILVLVFPAGLHLANAPSRPPSYIRGL
jgi:hypothetical protein